MYGDQSAELVPGYSELKGLNRGRVWKPWAGHTPTQTSLEWPPPPSSPPPPPQWWGRVSLMLPWGRCKGNRIYISFSWGKYNKVINKPTTSEPYWDQFDIKCICKVISVARSPPPTLTYHKRCIKCSNKNGIPQLFGLWKNMKWIS